MKSYEYVEMLKAKLNLPSDYKAAEVLQISRAAMSNYKNGRPLDDDLALTLGEKLEIDPSEILYLIRSEKAKDEATKNKWIQLAKMTAQRGFVSTNLLLILSFFSWTFHNCILCKIEDGADYA